MIVIANPFDRTTKYDSFRKQCSVCNQLKNGCRTAESCSIKRGQCAKLVNFLIVSMFLRVQNHYMPIITLMLKCMRLCVEIKVIETRTKWEGAREITRSRFWARPYECRARTKQYVIRNAHRNTIQKGRWNMPFIMLLGLFIQKFHRETGPLVCVLWALLYALSLPPCDGWWCACYKRFTRSSLY